MYSVLRSQGTCASGVEGPVLELECPFVYGPIDVRSPRRKASFGSSFGRLEGSGFISTNHRDLIQQLQRH